MFDDINKKVDEFFGFLDDFVDSLDKLDGPEPVTKPKRIYIMDKHEYEVKQAFRETESQINRINSTIPAGLRKSPGEVKKIVNYKIRKEYA